MRTILDSSAAAIFREIFIVKKLLVLGAGQNQLRAIQTARQMGFLVIAIDPRPQAFGLKAADFPVVSDLSDTQLVLSVAREHRVSGVFTLAADYSVPVLAEVCHALDLPGLTRHAARVSTDKQELRQVLSDAGVPGPASFPAESHNDVRRVLSEIRAPVIVKPRRGSAGRGVTQVRDDATRPEIETAFDRARQESWSGDVVVEEFVDGPEFSVEAITRNGTTRIVTVTEKTTVGPPYFVEIGHVLPAPYDTERIETLKKLTVNCVSALGIDNSGSHTEIRWGHDGPCIIECGARLGGGFIASHLVPLALGVDLVKAALSIAVGSDFNLEHTRQRSAAIRFLTAPAGRLERIAGTVACRRRSALRALHLDIRRGERIWPLCDNTARLGFVICESDDPRTARAEAALAAADIRFDVQSVEG